MLTIFVVVIFSLGMRVLFVVVVLTFAVVIMVVVLTVLIVGDGFDARGRDDHSPFEARRFGQPFEPAFKLQAINQENVRLIDRPRGLWRWLIHMRIAVGTHEGDHFDVVATNLAGHVTQDGKRGNDFEWLVGRQSPGQTKRNSGNGRSRREECATRRHFRHPFSGDL